MNQFINACLNLFNSIPNGEENEPTLVYEYGVVIPPSGYSYKDDVIEWLENNISTSKQLNASFHKSWSLILKSSNEELVIQQLIHYFSTYGLDSLGLYNSDYIYIPNEVLDLNGLDTLPIRVINVISNEDLKNKCLSLLSSGIALKQETIEDILYVLEGVKYQFTGNESINNKEARILIADKTGILPTNGDDLFRYIFYKATGNTLVVCSKDNITTIKSSNYVLPLLTDTQMIELSKSFKRDSKKALWLAIKNANKANVNVVNRLDKLSNKHYKPLPPNTLSLLTSSVIDTNQVIEAAQRANVFQLIRALNGVKFYKADNVSRYYRIRNGKGWAQETTCNVPSTLLRVYENVLLSELVSRLRTHKIHYPSHINYMLPTSGKAYIGNIPIGTIINLNKKRDSFLLGVYWEGDMVDLDLKADSIHYSIGWNTNYKSEEGSYERIMHSGDITSAPNGATEWVYCNVLSHPYQVKLNGFGCDRTGYPFRLMVAYGSDIEANYMCDPNKVVFESNMTMTQNEVTLGVIEPDGDNLRFILGGFGSGNARVGSYGKHSEIITNATIHQAKSSLYLRDVISSVPLEEADIDLSPNKLSKDSLMELFYEAK